jgi:ABC-type multidrug transport system fused ATPase/permease subunit
MFTKIFKILPDLKKKTFLYVFYLLTISILEIFGISLIVGLVVKLISNGELNNSSFFFNFISNYDFYIICAAIFFIFLIKFVLIFVLNKLLFKFCFNQQTKLRSRVVNSIFYKMKNYKYDNSIEFRNNFTLIFENCRTLTESFLINFLKFFCDICIFLIIILFLLFYNFKITFFLMLFFLLSFILYKYLFKKKFKQIGENKLESYKNLIDITDTIINSLKEIIVFRQEKTNLNKINKFSKDFEVANNEFSSLSILPRLFIEFSIIFFLIFLVIYANNLVNFGVYSFIGLATTYAVATLRLAPLLNTIIYSFTIFWNSKKIITEFDNQFLEFDQFESEIIVSNEPFNQLILSKLNFSYKDKKIFDNFDITLNKNEIIGIFGKSGTGKSTLIDILLGFKKPTKFELKINNVDIKDITKIRGMISYIPQNIFLYNESIKKNIVLDEIDNFSEKRYLNSLQFSKCNEFVNNFKEGDEYIVGRAGEKLSVGQKQRVALARSLYNQKKILILDEPTSSLDTDTENKILLNLLNIKRELSIIIISHNKETIKICDKIYDLDNILIRT